MSKAPQNNNINSYTNLQNMNVSNGGGGDNNNNISSSEHDLSSAPSTVKMSKVLSVEIKVKVLEFLRFLRLLFKNNFCLKIGNSCWF